ncbi:MAG: DUF1800 domain-containing protein [Betaproteobacteria bacterium]|nr:DUF1800 domain-containing protein [Betaproteobacteria bacterium]
MRNTVRIFATLSVALAMQAGASSAATADAVEYYHAASNHYFLTASPGEVAFMDGSPNWRRTGASFKVWPTAADAPAGAVAACVYNAPVIGADVRFYSVDMGECDFLSTFDLASYGGVQFYAVPAVNGACANDLQPIRRGFFDNGQGNINFRYSTTLSAAQDSMDRGWNDNGVTLCVPGTSMARRADIIRLLRQATFGPTDELISRVEQLGINAWLAEQFVAPKSAYPDLPYVAFNRPDTCTGSCSRDNYTLFPVQVRFLQNAYTGQDQLRQRVAFALSQIIVTSGIEVNHPYGMARYQQILLDHAFGNYRDVLYHTTLSPVMGRFLDMANSNKPDVARGISANENFARELLQLFSVGLYDMNMDGTLKTNQAGEPIPTYSQTTVENFARVFTGWTYPPVGGGTATRNNGVNYEAPMQAVQSNHDTNAKTLLNGVVLPAGRTAEQDLNAALDNIFNHPNVPPFVARQLIQKLVGGSPSPAYVGRVAAVFANNGFFQRGDLRAVVQAILTDPEARGDLKATANYGHLVEPILLTTQMMRGLGGTSDGVYESRQLGSMAQSIFSAPSVFNFYPPDRKLPATGSTAPEFAILNTGTVFARANFINNIVMGNAIAADTSVTGATGTRIDWTPWQALAGNPAALVDKLAWTFTAGSLSDSARNIIITAVNAVSATDTLTRAKTAAYLVLNASQTQVER